MTNVYPTGEQPRAKETSEWLPVLRRYMLFVAAANLTWEFAHMPLYTLWETGTAGEIVFAAVHCTGGDILIALSAVMLSLFLFGTGSWPGQRRRIVVVSTVVFGLAYTIFSEWLNIVIRQAWAYSDLMPVIPLIDAGLSPFLQWIVVPLAGFYFANAFPTASSWKRASNA
ncbi:MAG: hypothetical protein RKK11_05045 [Alphaproteobacteria bacterium]